MGIVGSTVSLVYLSLGMCVEIKKSTNLGPASIKSTRLFGSALNLFAKTLPPRPARQASESTRDTLTFGCTSYNDICVRIIGQRRRVGINHCQDRRQKESGDNGKAHGGNHKKKVATSGSLRTRLYVACCLVRRGETGRILSA